MELNKNSFLAKFYIFMFNGNLPFDFCTLFWNTVLAIVLFPIAILAVNPLFKGEFWNNTPLFIKTFAGVVQWFLLLLLGMAGGAILALYFGREFIHSIPLIYILLMGVIVSIVHFIVLIGVILIIGSLIKEFVEKIRERKHINYVYREPKPSKIKIIWGAIRNKYCTKIEWK